MFYIYKILNNSYYYVFLIIFSMFLHNIDIINISNLFIYLKLVSEYVILCHCIHIDFFTGLMFHIFLIYHQKFI
jgi:hypothetical protein